MTFSDWVHGTRHRIQNQPPRTALKYSVREFLEGGRSRLALLVHARRGWTSSTLAGESVRFDVREPVDVRRALTLLNEENVLEWLLTDASSDCRFWDVGGYHGHYSIVAAAKGCDVVTFEPDDDNRARVGVNATLNGADLEIRECALSDRSTMKLFGGDVGSELRIHDEGERTIETRRGDDLEPSPDLVKIDVEGHELEVLSGMWDTLDAVQRIAVEVHAEDDVPLVEFALEARGFETEKIDTPRSQTYIGGERRGES